MRLFIAIRFSKEIDRALLDCMEGLKRQGVKGNYTPAENLHLTLAFIGETDQIIEVTDAMKSVEFDPFPIEVGGFGNFGRLLWIGVKSEPALRKYVKQLRKALEGRGISFDRKKFKEHITIVRRAQASGSIIVPEIHAGMTVRRISLMKSARINGRMVYTEMFATEGRIHV